MVERKRLPICNVSQLNLGADLEHEARFDTLNDLALDLVSDGAFQIQVEAKQDRSPAPVLPRVRHDQRLGGVARGEAVGCTADQTLPRIRQERPAHVRLALGHQAKH